MKKERRTKSEIGFQGTRPGDREESDSGIVRASGDLNEFHDQIADAEEAASGTGSMLAETNADLLRQLADEVGKAADMKAFLRKLGIKTGIVSSEDEKPDLGFSPKKKK